MTRWWILRNCFGIRRRWGWNRGGIVKLLNCGIVLFLQVFSFGGFPVLWRVILYGRSPDPRLKWVVNLKKCKDPQRKIFFETLLELLIFHYQNRIIAGLIQFGNSAIQQFYAPLRLHQVQVASTASNTAKATITGS